MKGAYLKVSNNNRPNEENGLLGVHEESTYSDNEDYFGANEDPFDL